eukprot:Protomagalhaensia_sp_Gyna_25__3680@NODE_3301_length_632_cov_1355_290051_g2769_i0_p1_GENE_NODE_3301_length_632_cov_1355_290051_g2769_i0NODE_3301_length_632_cov_1355_290051_g2769_i0_p1_ORF_typecomplete_len142_score14_31ARID/PF01388_21/1_1e06_NODE_3301_length_632_cov_1355_290051_g2769_i06431
MRPLLHKCERLEGCYNDIMTLDKLYELFLLVLSEGGFGRVNRNHRWNKLGLLLRFECPNVTTTQIGMMLKRVYSSICRSVEWSLPWGVRIALTLPRLREQLPPPPSKVRSVYGSPFILMSNKMSNPTWTVGYPILNPSAPP